MTHSIAGLASFPTTPAGLGWVDRSAHRSALQRRNSSSRRPSAIKRRKAQGGRRNWPPPPDATREAVIDLLPFRCHRATIRRYLDKEQWPHPHVGAYN